MDYGRRLSNGVANLNMEEFGQSLKDMAGTVGSMSIKGFDRAKQFSQEKMGNAVKTELDQDFIALSARVEETRSCVSKTSTAARNFLQPNAAARLEDMFNETVTGKGSNIDKRQTYSELMGHIMKTSGQQIGDSIKCGPSFVEVGETFQKLGMLEREYIRDVYNNFFKPFSNHLQVEYSNITAEKRRLDLARLDLDAAKSKVRGARTPEAMQQNEQKVRECQAAFDRQYEQTKILLTEADRKSDEFTCHLEEFIRSQMNYHEQAHKMLSETHANLKK